jgi:hypothetical protein
MMRKLREAIALSEEVREESKLRVNEFDLHAAAASPPVVPHLRGRRDVATTARSSLRQPDERSHVAVLIVV